MTSRPLAIFVSFRLGGTDGVSVEATKWEAALQELGFVARRVAGEILDTGHHDDVVVPGLAIGATTEPDPRPVEQAVEGADLVVVENLLSLPLNLPAARMLEKILGGATRVVLRHHDLPWQREAHATVTELPPDLPGAVHVTINDRSRHELAVRGVPATTIRNHFDVDAPPGDRDGARRRVGAEPEDLVVLHPVRAIPRKNVPRALEFAGDLDERLPDRRVRYWLPGIAEDNYEWTLGAVLRDAPVPVIRTPRVRMADAYAASDLVVFPSRWEGFGNPVVESVVARRPLAVNRYPVLEELLDLGFEFLSVDDPDTVAAVMTGEHDLSKTMERNLDLARRHLDIKLLPRRLAALFAEAGWSLP